MYKGCVFVFLKRIVYCEVNEVGIGKNIKTIRQLQKISQSELCIGICTQAHISQIENDLITPSAETVFRLGKRLGVDLNYLLESSYDEKYEYKQEVLHQFRKATQERDYHKLKTYVEHEKNNPIFKEVVFQRVLFFYQGVYTYYLDHEVEKAIQMITEGIEISPYIDEFVLQMMLGRANIYSDTKQFKLARQEFENIISFSRDLPVMENKNLKIKIHYNYALVLRKLKDLRASLKYFESVISFCHEHELMVVLGDAYFYAARNKRDLGNKNGALVYFKKALSLYEVKENIRMINLTKKELESFSQQAR